MLPPLRTLFFRLLEGAVVLGALASIPVIIAQEQGASDLPLVIIADWLIWAIFTTEYLVLLTLAPARGRFVRSNLLSLGVIVLSFPLLPHVLGIVRLIRLVRLALVTLRGLRALRAALGRPGLIYSAGVTALLVLAGATAVTVLEPEVVNGDFGDAMWWAAVTVTTTGYGDIAPQTLGGRLVAVAIMFAGVVLVSILAAAIAAYFVGQDESADRHALIERLDRLEARLLAAGDSVPARPTETS